MYSFVHLIVYASYDRGKLFCYEFLTPQNIRWGSREKHYCLLPYVPYIHSPRFLRHSSFCMFLRNFLILCFVCSQSNQYFRFSENIDKKFDPQQPALPRSLFSITQFVTKWASIKHFVFLLDEIFPYKIRRSMLTPPRCVCRFQIKFTATILLCSN